MEDLLNDKTFDYVCKFFGEFQAAIGPDEDGYMILYNGYYPMSFYKTYNDVLKSLPFTRKEFDDHEHLQELITEFELDKEAFWKLVVYLYDYITDACKNTLTPQKSSQEVLDELKELNNGEDKFTSITIETKTGKKLTVTDSTILKCLIFDFDFDRLREWERITTLRPLIESDKEDTRRKAGYFFLEHLVKFFGLDDFPQIKRRKGASVSNKEKELILALLYVCKFMDNPESFLDTGYFRKLKKDYEGSKLNMSNKYELGYF